jgi:hypothetical protein
MPSKYVKVDSENLKVIVSQYKEITGRSMPDIVRAFARVCAVELANRTQPFTVGSNGRQELERGSAHLKKDIPKAVKTKDNAREKSERFNDEEIKQRLLAMVAAGRWDVIANIFAATKVIRTPGDFHLLASGEIPGLHKQQRSRRTGHTLGTRGEYHIASSGFDPYVSTVAKRLGYTKSGWAECARKIGGVKGDGARGIPAFAKRQRAANYHVDSSNGEDTTNPHFVMTNTTPWLSRLLPPRDQAESSRVAGEKMIKAMNIALRYAAKQGVNVREFVNRLTENT